MEETHKNHPKKPRRNTIKVDRLSALPDFLLIDILSLLRPDSAARTSVLSHRWRHLWTHITRIHIDCSNSLEWPASDYYGRFNSFCTTVDHIFTQLNSPKIRSFHLGCPALSPGLETQQCCSYLGSWVPLICGRKPEEIEVMLADSDAFIIMPMCVFICPSLVKLRLIGKFDCKLPDNYEVGSISLPNLKELAMRNIDMDLKLLGTVIRSCPLLEALYLELNLDENELVLDISAQNLKFLCVTINGSSRRSKFVIDAPNLQGFGLQGRFVIYHFVSKLSALNSATIGFWDSTFRGQDDYRSEISKLVQRICNVGFLKLLHNLAIFNPVNHLHPDVFETFSNLTELCLTYDSRQELGRTAPFPVCLLTRLKYVELIEINGDAKGLKLVKYILRHANVLETLIIKVLHRYGNDKDNLWSEYEFCDALFEMQTSSSSCDIKFQGLYINASSTGYQGGSLSCQVNYDFQGVDEMQEISDFSEDSE